MCFSASASFITAALLSVAGGIGISMARNRSEYLLSLTPFLFAIQQACEGWLWLTGTTNAMSRMLVYVYLTFVYLVWPLWIPTVMMFYESDMKRRFAMLACLIPGLSVASYMIYAIYGYGAQAVIEGHHVLYQIQFPIFHFVGFLLSGLYCIATIMPFFISSKRDMWIVGVALALSYLVSLFFFYVHAASVWCFFGAIISSLIIYVIYKNR